MYNPSETSECYMVLANPQRQIWFIPQRHLLASCLIDSDELFLTKDQAAVLQRSRRAFPRSLADGNGESESERSRPMTHKQRVPG